MKKNSFLLVCLSCFALCSKICAEIQVVDITGREVAIKQPAERVILGEGRFLAALGILDDAPVERVVGMMGEFKRFDPDGYAHWQSSFPAIDNIPRIGSSSADTVSIEQVVRLKPDLLILGLSGHGPSAKSADILRILDAAGIPYVFIDFREEPLANTPESISILGKLLGKETKAMAFTKFYSEELAKVTDVIESEKPPRPSVFLHMHVGLNDSDCRSIGNNLLGAMIPVAGGHNIAEELLGSKFGMVSAEYLFANQPDIYIGTAIGSASGREQSPQKIALGVNIDQETGVESFRTALEFQRVSSLTAIQEKQALALWHHFYNHPFNIVALQVMAKKFHPDQFAELSPENTLKILYDEFQPISLNGIYWTHLK